MREAWIFPGEEKRESIPPILRHNSTITTTNLPKIHHQHHSAPTHRATKKKSNTHKQSYDEKIKQRKGKNQADYSSQPIHQQLEQIIETLVDSKTKPLNITLKQC